MTGQEDDFSYRIKEYFKKQNMTQQDIAKKINASQSYVTCLLNGKKEFGKVAAQKWHDLFGISTAFLLTRSGPIVEDQKEDDDQNGEVANLTKMEISLLEIIKEKDRQVAKKDEQIDRLLTIIEDLSSPKRGVVEDAGSADVG